jgi:xanthine phosphoribosyltransferase
MSFTKGALNFVSVCAEFISENDKVLIIDDFLADGNAVNGMLDICKQAGAEVVGVGICIEKYFQNGGKKLRENGINLYSQAILDLDDDGNIKFVNM